MLVKHRRSQGKGARAPPNRNASNDKFVTKNAIIFSVFFFVFTLTLVHEDHFFFGPHLL